uniref:Cell cycle checkpoint protein RAD17 n=1 Tax=Culex pipiens TaxID=7175 RepID=A0A8D8FCE5_CULPI
MSSNKSKRWFTSAFDTGPSPAPVKRSDSVPVSTTTLPATAPATKRSKLTTRTSSFSQPKKEPVATQSRVPDWSVDLAPKKLADLAVHPKKLEEIQHWLKTYDRVKGTEPVAFLLISGPPGCGKSTAVKIVTEELGYEVKEWTTPVDVDMFFHDNYDFEGGREEVTYRENRKTQFEKFLYKSSRYCSILEIDSKEKLLLVKDIPNVFLRDPEAFRSTLETYQRLGASPLVFIATETSNKKLDIVFNLFTPAVLNDFKVHHITFNAVSTTLMKKAIKRLTSLMVGPEMSRQYRVPPQDMIDSVVLSSQGDLRSVTLNLHFASLKNAPRLSTEQVNVGEVLNSSGVATGGRGKKKESKLKSVGCAESLTLFHALGRVFHPKIERVPGQPDRFQHSPETLAEAFTSQPHGLISLAHSNYVLRFTDIDDICGAADALSVADIIMSEYREDQLAGHALNVAIRGMMVCNRKTASGWHQIRKTKTYQRPSVAGHEVQLKKYGLETSSVSAGLFMTDYKKYLDIILAGKV